jgi:hypothetical protein
MPKNPGQGRLLNAGDGPTENIELSRCFVNARRARRYYVRHNKVGMEWSASKDSWVIDRLEDTWAHSTMPSPAQTERTMAQALLAPCIGGTLSMSGNIGPSFHPTSTESRAAKNVKDPKLFCDHMKQREAWRPQKIIHTVGVTENDGI